MFSLPYMTASDANAIFSHLLLQACIFNSLEVVRTILRSGVIDTYQFITFRMIIDLFKVSRISLLLSLILSLFLKI